MVLGGKSRSALILIAGVLALGAYSPAWAADATTTVVSVSSTGSKGNGDSFLPVVTPDGRWVAFTSSSTNLASPASTGTTNVFLRDRLRGETIQVNLTPLGSQPDAGADGPAISDDGRYVAFYSSATNLTTTPGGLQAYLFDRTTKQIRRMSTNVASNLTYTVVNDVELSGDGRKLLYNAEYETAPFTTRSDVFVADVASGAVKRLGEPSPGVQANGDVYNPAVSDDGHWAAYGSSATNLVPADGNGAGDVFEENLDTGARFLVSVRSDGAQTNGSSQGPSVSSDGCVVSFGSSATNIVVGAELSGTKAFVRDRCQNTVEAGSVTNAGTVETSNAFPRLSGDGCSVAYLHGSPRAVMLRDRCSGQSLRLDVSTTGEPSSNGVNVGSFDLSGVKGRYAVFASPSTNLAGADSDALNDVFLRDRANNTPPKAAAAVTQSGSRVTVDATGSKDPDGFALTGSVGFGDGTPESTGLTASHDYTRGGTYTLTVTVTDADGATDRTYQAVTVPDPPAPPAGGGAGPSGTPQGDGATLRLSGARLSRSTFAVVPANGRPTGNRGATLSATLSEASTVTLSFSRRTKGRRSGGRCKPGARRGSPCTIYKTVGSSSRSLAAGAVRIALTGRVDSKTLAPGTYRLGLRAKTADGRRSAALTLSFTIVRAARR